MVYEKSPDPQGHFNIPNNYLNLHSTLDVDFHAKFKDSDRANYYYHFSYGLIQH
jgi:hypothetical protein